MDIKEIKKRDEVNLCGPEDVTFLLAEVEGLQNTIAQMQDAEQMIYECRMKGGDTVRHLLDNLLAENKRLKTEVELLEKENAALREVVENIENDDGRIPKTIWDMRNKALEKIKDE